MVQNPLDSHNIMDYIQTIERLSNVMSRVATENHQRMKIKWLSNGDKASKNFHNKMKMPKTDNKNKCVRDANGNLKSA